MPTHTEVDRRLSLDRLRAEARSCEACDLYLNATQTVFGEGPRRAPLMLVGEQPGDEEDIAGRPFVGPAGRVLERALGQAGIDRQTVYVTNAVKHFRWNERRGKKRIHKRPNAAQIGACKPWLLSEIAAVRPEVVVLMGTTAVESLLGSAQTITSLRGRPIKGDLVPLLMVTVHPSSVLRAQDDQSRRRQMAEFVLDLRRALKLVISRRS